MRHAPSFWGRLPTRWVWWLRRRLRSPFLYWTAAAAVGVLTASGIARSLDAAEAERDRYGRWVTAVVATRDLPSGHELDADDVRSTRLPAAMVPRTAWHTAPLGQRLRHPIADGEVLVRARTVEAPSATAARLSPDQRAVAVPLGDSALALTSGDRVDVADLDPDDGTYRNVTTGVAVVAVSERTVTLAIPLDDVAPVQNAVAAGTVQLALVAPETAQVTGR